jgi:hypothetical protein
MCEHHLTVGKTLSTDGREQPVLPAHPIHHSLFHNLFVLVFYLLFLVVQPRGKNRKGQPPKLASPIGNVTIAGVVRVSPTIPPHAPFF